MFSQPDLLTIACVASLKGHRSNVFSASFMPSHHTSRSGSSSTVVSGGNDADCRVFDVETSTCTSVYEHFSRKVCG